MQLASINKTIGQLGTTTTAAKRPPPFWICATGINKVIMGLFCLELGAGINKWVTIGRLLKTTAAAKRPPSWIGATGTNKWVNIIGPQSGRHFKLVQLASINYGSLLVNKELRRPRSGRLFEVGVLLLIELLVSMNCVWRAITIILLDLLFPRGLHLGLFR